MPVDVDVVVVGFGPGGEVISSLLGQNGHRVAVFEKYPQPYGLPRMSTLDGEIARVLQHTGDAEQALAESIPQPNYLFYGADGEVALEVDWRFDICGHPARLSLHQPHIEASMQDSIARCPSVDVHWGAKVTALQDLGDAVRVTAQTPDGEKVVTAKYVVGMDGASSFVRRTLGIDLEVLHTHTDQWILTDFDIIDPAVQPPPTIINMRPSGPYFWGPNGARRCRTDVRIMPGESASELMDDAHGYQWLEDNIGIDRSSVKITRRKLYRFLSQYATSFRRGRIFLGGDAAHSMTPYMAQGSCSAMRDSMNLGWKLDAVLQGRADEDLLDTYEEERLAAVIPVVQGSLKTWELLIELEPEAAAARDVLLRSGQAPPPHVPPLVNGLLHRGRSEAVTAPVGHLSPQGRVRINDREGLLDDLTGFGFQLVSAQPLDDVLTDACRTHLTHLGVKVVVLGDQPGQATDLDGTYERFFAEHRVTAYLSRPDFYIYGVAATAADVPDIIEELAFTLAPNAVGVQ
jgi:3-(3-hydroxy-phenyl)propionate hydroxylase